MSFDSIFSGRRLEPNVQQIIDALSGVIAIVILHLKAGTAAVNSAPLKFTLPGVLNTTAEAGAVETTAERLYYTPTSLARQVIPGVLFTQTASATVGNTTDEATIIGSGVGSLTLPANFFIVGKTLRFKSAGVFSESGNHNLNIQVKLGSTAVLTTGATSITGAGTTNQGYELYGEITCRSVGAGGTVMAQGMAHYHTAHTGVEDVDMENTATVAINTTSALAFDITADWSNAEVGDTITGTNLVLEVLN